MPAYDYQCKNCGKKFEVKISYRETNNVSCPYCETIDVKRLIIFAPQVHFKGNGFTKAKSE